MNGTITQQNFSDGTMMYRRADPNVVYWQGKYYFIATNEGADRNISIRVARHAGRILRTLATP